VTLEINARPVVEGPFHLGEWLVEPRLNRLIKDTRSIQIELKMMDVLVCLADHAGELVERQELIDTVWATEFISENILTRAIAELRSVLGDDARNPSFIETIHRRGYRLIAPIEAAVSDEAATAKVARFPVPDKLIEEERSPYPGLASFTKDDAEYFFGREAEVAQMWRKITTRRLLAVIGPSGVGKSSLLRAGLITSAPEGWGTLICHPGEAPFAALARLLAPEFEGDTDAIGQLVDITDEGAALALITRWRERFDQALLIIDQFEELFTLNIAEVQARFANLLGSTSDVTSTRRSPRSSTPSPRSPHPSAPTSDAPSPSRRHTSDSHSKTRRRSRTCSTPWRANAAACLCSPSPSHACGRVATRTPAASPATPTRPSAACTAPWRSTPKRRCPQSAPRSCPSCARSFATSSPQRAHERRASGMSCCRSLT
jgi:DNA-binding winged helix-turn-helix (wHTH) protein